MKTINSVSGGRTSSYMAYHYPADYNVFALVTIDDIKCKPKDDKLIQMVSDKIGRQFIATAESDETLQVMFDLEQLLGREIVWVAGDSFDNIMKRKKIIPNQFHRWCTAELKIYPIIRWAQKNNIGFPYDLNLGIRADESERAKVGEAAKLNDKIIVGKHPNGKNKWQKIQYANAKYPLIQDRIFYPKIIDWTNKTNLKFPKDSNCIGCFWKPVYQLRKNYEDEPNKMEWFSSKEKLFSYDKKMITFKQGISYEQISKLGLQSEMVFGTGAGCQAGFCTD